MDKNELKNDLKSAVKFGLLFLCLYFILAFFLKSEYPLIEHSFNGKDAYDVLKDAIALLSPFVIAYTIYHIWHAQKGKEVIAHEARELIKDFLEYIIILGKLAHLTKRTHDELVAEVEDLKKLRLKIFRGLHYFTECMDDKSLEAIVDAYNEKEGLLERKMNFMSRNLGPMQFKKDILASQKEIDVMVDSAEKVIEKIKPYSTYQKRFKFK